MWMAMINLRFPQEQEVCRIFNKYRLYEEFFLYSIWLICLLASQFICILKYRQLINVHPTDYLDLQIWKLCLDSISWVLEHFEILGHINPFLYVCRRLINEVSLKCCKNVAGPHR